MMAMRFGGLDLVFLAVGCYRFFFMASFVACFQVWLGIANPAIFIRSEVSCNCGSTFSIATSPNRAGRNNSAMAFESL